MKKNGSLALSLAFVAALGMGFTGCGTDAEDIVDAYTNGNVNGNVNGDDVYDNYTNGDYDDVIANAGDYSYLVIYKNISAVAKDELLSGYDYYEGFQTESVSNGTSCTDYGFSSSTADSYDYGYGEVTTYYSDDYTRACTETDFSSYDYYSGRDAVLITYNY